MSDDLGQPRLGKHGGPRKRGERNPETMPTGVRRDYILRRLERDGRHDLAQAIREDRVSAYSIAVELGWTTRPEPIGTGSVNASKQRQYRLRTLMNGGALPRTGSSEGLTCSQAFELWLGPNPTQGSLFADRAALEEAWTVHRDEIMRRWGSHGRRPAGFYEFEWDGPRPPYAVERSTLWRMDVLSQEERSDLEAEWKTAFDAARGMDARERREHLAHHDVPAELIREWTVARRRGRRQPTPSQEEAAAIK